MNPTDWALTSQKHTSLPHVLDRGRYAIRAAQTVQRMFAAVAVNSREFGTFNVIVPPMIKATICTASPTDLSSVVLVVENPRSLIMIVEKELTTPFGIALKISANFVLGLWIDRTYAANTETKSSKAFGSAKARSACFKTNFLFLIPVSLPATRFTAMRRSRSFKKRQFDGASGSRKYITKAHRQVTPPRIKNINSQRSGVRSFGSLETPIEMYEPIWKVRRTGYQLRGADSRYRPSRGMSCKMCEKSLKLNLGHNYLLPNALSKWNLSPGIPKTSHQSQTAVWIC